ncbi:MAG TPA: hypothetical protein VFA04_16355, partial [Bryobacteraceae bacterium]|nr:hypothetical protein [Bryobacteraceae bacterium]
SGDLSGSPEIHEKILAKTGCGAVVVFATAAGDYSYITANRPAPRHVAPAHVTVTPDRAGRAKIDIRFEKPGAKVIWFGVDSE